MDQMETIQNPNLKVLHRPTSTEDLIAQQTCTPEFQLLLHLRVTKSNQPRTDLTQRRRLTSTNPGIEHDRTLGFPVTKVKAPHGAHFVGMWTGCCKMVTRHGWECSPPSQPPMDGGGVGGRLSLQVRHPFASRELGWKGADPKLLYFKWSPPWHIFPTFYLTFFLTYTLYSLSGIYSGSLSGIYSEILPQFLLGILSIWCSGPGALQQHLELAIWSSGPGVTHCIRSWQRRRRWIRRRRKELHLCQNLETLTWQVGKKQTRLFFWGILLSLAC